MPKPDKQNPSKPSLARILLARAAQAAAAKHSEPAMDVKAEAMLREEHDKLAPKR